MVSVLRELFQYMDTIITHTNRSKTTAYIWGSIDEEERKVLAEVIIDGGRKSRILATAIERTIHSHKLLHAGVITAPRLMQTFQHYQKNGGMIIFPRFRKGKMKVAANH